MVTIGGTPSCANCKVELDPVVTLGAPTDAELPRQVSLIAIDSRRRFFVGAIGDYRVLVYDSAGRYVRLLTRKGQGPGELTGLVHIAFGAGDNIFTVDNSGRVNVSVLISALRKRSGYRVGVR